MAFPALRATVLTAVLALAAASTPLWAAGPDTREMIEALKPSATRSMRNLHVVQREEDAASAAASAAAVAAAAAAAAATAPEGPAPSLSLSIQFELNSSHVRPESGPLLGNLVAAMQSPELKAARFIIEGHTDARGQASANQRLSQERAEEVRLYLVALGVHPSRLRAVGKGASEPVNARDPLAAENRRVRVVTVQ